MPPPGAMFVAFLLVLPPCYGIAVILTDTRIAPHQRTVRATGGGLIINCIVGCIFTVMGLIESQWLPSIAPIALFIATIAAVLVIMREESSRHSPVK